MFQTSKQMIRFFILFLFSSLFLSCASHKSNESHLDYQQEIKQVETSNKLIESSANQIDWSLVYALEDIEINIKRYDTSALPDAKGNYPLKEEQNLKKQKETQATNSSEQKLDIKTEESKKEDKKEVLNIINDELNTSNQEVGYSFSFGYLWIIALLIAAIYLIKKYIFKK